MFPPLLTCIYFSYRVWDIVRHSFPKHWCGESRINIFSIKVFILAVEHEGGRIAANEVGESLSHHGETEHRAILPKKKKKVFQERKKLPFLHYKFNTRVHSILVTMVDSIYKHTHTYLLIGIFKKLYRTFSKSYSVTQEGNTGWNDWRAFLRHKICKIKIKTYSDILTSKHLDGASPVLQLCNKTTGCFAVFLTTYIA